MTSILDFTLSFEGNLSDNSQIDFYDVATALIGFQRSLALTTHLVLNGEIITQAPSLKGATILAAPPEEGSWKIKASVITSLALGGAYHLATAPRDTPLGNLVSSAYDYVINESLGFHVDYQKTLGQQYDELKKQENHPPILSQARFDSLIDKCDNAMKYMHRPIIASGTARVAQVVYETMVAETKIGATFSEKTFEYLDTTTMSDFPMEFTGKVSSYNSNLYNGRIYIPNLHRTIQFDLEQFH